MLVRKIINISTRYFCKEVPSPVIALPFRKRFAITLKGTFHKWGDYWLNVGRDYQEVSIGILKECKEKPLKSSIYLSIIGSVAYCLHTNPDTLQFHDQLQECLNDASMIANKIRNQVVYSHLLYLDNCFTHDVLHRLSLGIISFMWVDNYAPQCSVFKARCSYLKPRYVTFYERVVDIGFLGRWWILENNMTEFDVSPQDWENSSIA